MNLLVITAGETLSYRLNARRSEKQFCCLLDKSFKTFNLQSLFRQDGRWKKCFGVLLLVSMQSISDRKYNLMALYNCFVRASNTQSWNDSTWLFSYIVHFAIVSLNWTDFFHFQRIASEEKKFFATLNCWKPVNKRTFKLFCLKKLRISV